MKRIFWVLMSIIALVSAGAATAQRGGERPTARFDAVAPQVGEVLPDLVLHDRTGKSLRLRELTRDHYTVLVLGCLT